MDLVLPPYGTAIAARIYDKGHWNNASTSVQVREGGKAADRRTQG